MINFNRNCFSTRKLFFMIVLVLLQFWILQHRLARDYFCALATSKSANTSINLASSNFVCFIYRHHFEIVCEQSGHCTRLHDIESSKRSQSQLVTAVDLCDGHETELLLCYNRKSLSSFLLWLSINWFIYCKHMQIHAISRSSKTKTKPTSSIFTGIHRQHQLFALFHT